MNSRVRAATALASIAAMLLLAGCGGNSSTDTTPETTADSETTAPAETTAPVETPSPSKPASDIEAAVQKVVKALDDLDIKHTEPVRTEAALGAKASFELTINGFDSGMNVFPDADQLASWSEVSDSLGGVHVAFDNAALSLNSSEGISNSAEIAPKIADAIGGEAHGV